MPGIAEPEFQLLLKIAEDLLVFKRKHRDKDIMYLNSVQH